MTEVQRQLAIRLLREQSSTIANKTAALRKAFGSRLTIALTSECDEADAKVEVLEMVIAELEKRETTDA